MSLRARYEDIATVLYILPILAAIGYALVLWVEAGVSAFLPSSVYLTVTRDPTLFIAGSLAILLGIMIEVNSTELQARPAKLASLGRTLQSIAIASLILVLLSAWYANGLTDLSGAGTDFLIGRYGLVFPSVLVLLSYLLTARFRLQSLLDRKALALIAMLLVPVSLYEVGRRSIALGLGIGFVLLAAGLFLFLYAPRASGKPKEE